MALKFSKDFYRNDQLGGGAVILKIGHESTIRAHRAVLASFSSYFEALLGVNWKEGNEDEIEILGLDETAVSVLIEFAYSGTIDINKDNVKSLLEVADYLEVESVKKSCADLLKEDIGNKTCLSIWQLADVFALEKLREMAKQHTLRHFTDVCKEDEFLCLPCKFLTELIANDELCVVIEGLIPCVEEREKVVMEAVFHYIEYDEENRKDVLPELLTLVRLPTLSEEYLEAVTKHNLVAGSCEEILKKALQLKLQTSEKYSPDEKWAVPREFGKTVLTWGPSYASGAELQPEYWDDTDVDKIGDVKNNNYVTGMALWIREWHGSSVIGQLMVKYNDDSPINSPMFIGNDDDDDDDDDVNSDNWKRHEFDLEEDEKIVKVEVEYSAVIDQLTFYTNKKDVDGQLRQYGPYGGDGGDHYETEIPEGSYGFLAGVVAVPVKSAGITRLQFVWRTYVFSGDPVPLENNCLCELFYNYCDLYYGGDVAEADYLCHKKYPGMLRPQKFNL